MGPMDNTNRTIALSTWINIAITLVFTVLFLIKGSYEFLFYTATIAVLIFIIETTDRKFHYPNLAKFGFNIWLFLHFSGGALMIGKTRLYDLMLVPVYGDPLYILKYDQVIHGYCYFVVTLFVYSIVLHISDKKANLFLVGLITVLAGASIGAINEILEFTTVVLFNAGDAVGDYFNNALDLIFNFIGATIAVLVVLPKKQNA